MTEELVEEVRANTKDVIFNLRFLGTLSKDVQHGREAQLKTNQVVGQCLKELAEAQKQYIDEIESLSAIIIKMSKKIEKLEKKREV